MKNKKTRGLIVGGAVFLCSLILLQLDAFRALEWKTWDLRLQQLANPAHASDDIVIFLIDQESLDVYQDEQGLSWPWPRQMYSAIVLYCQRAGVKALILDLIFSEGSVYGVEDDLDFARTMSEAGNVFLPISLHQSPKETDVAWPSVLMRFSLPKSDVPDSVLFPTKSITLPVEDLLAAAKGIGNVLTPQDNDGIFRRIPLAFSLDDLILPALPLALSAVVGDRLELDQIPLDRSGNMIIRFHGPSGTYESYSIASIINSYANLESGLTPQFSPEEFKDKIVLVGGSAPGLLDLRPTPLSAVYPGVEIQATVIDNLLQKDFIHVMPKWIVILYVLFLAILTGLGTSLISKVWKTVVFASVCVVLPLTGAVLGFLASYWVDFVAPVFAVLLSFTAASLLNYSFEGRQKRFIKSAFRHYLSPHVIDRVLEDPSQLSLGGESRDITAFFSDVAGFTSVSENLSPEDLVQLLNDYLSEMTDIILDSGGTLDKYEGDAIIAFWNAPLDLPDHALRACRSALLCQKRLKEIRPRFQEQYGHGLTVRIGLNSGPAVVGNMGSHRRFDYTAMGDTMNLASRLEGACKQYHVPILVGEKTFAHIKDDIITREVDLIRVVGKAQPVRVYEILGEKSDLSSSQWDEISIFHHGLEMYREQRWDEAIRLFQNSGDTPLVQLYVERTKALKESPPPNEWTGVFDLKQK
ncbi:CHASE2 domain-containing protein [Acidobacteriota bacterium]